MLKWACVAEVKTYDFYYIQVYFLPSVLWSLDRCRRSFQVSLAVLLVYSIASLAVNAFLFLYKTRMSVFAIYALLPSISAIYPLCMAAWVTKQYSWYVKYKSYLQERILKFELITLNETSRVEARKFFFILCLQPRDKAAMFGVNTIEFFLEQFTWK